MKTDFFFQLATRLHYGLGKTRGLGDLLKANGYACCLVLVDNGCAESSAYYAEILELIKANSRTVHVETLRGTEEPDYDYLDAVTAAARALNKVDAVIGIGGGSCLDIAKAVAVLLTNPGRSIDYRGFDLVKTPGVPTIAIPTTAGTGSEVTINAVFTDKAQKKKLGINGLHMHATHAFLDAEWTLSCPPSVALSAGLDAVAHSLESYMCKNANRLIRVFSSQAFLTLYRALPCLVEEPDNVEMRQEILLGAYLAAAALFNSGSGIAGALSYPLGVHFKIPHGICGGIFISAVVKYNVAAGYQEYAELYDLVANDGETDRQRKNEVFADLLTDLCRQLNVPRDLSQWGVTPERLETILPDIHNLQAAFDQNPVPFSAQRDAVDMLRQHLGRP